MRDIRVAFLISLVAVLGLGCSGYNAQGNVLWHLENQESVWLAVDKRDFEGIDPAEADPTSEGSNLLKAAVRFSGGASKATRDHGIPDAVRVIFTGNPTSPTQATRIELAYLRQQTVIVVDPRDHSLRSMQHFELDPLSSQARPQRSNKPINEQEDIASPQYHSRPFTDDDFSAVDPDLALRLGIERWARVLTIGRRLALEVEPSDFAAGSAYKERPGFAYNYLTVPVTAASANLFGESTDHLPGRYIAWVLPSTPAAEVLEPGWRILTINGQPVESFEMKNPGQELELLLQRSNETRTVTVSPERRPIDVSFGVWSISRSAFSAVSSSTAHVGVGGPLMNLFPSDDALAALLGHEIAHVAQTVIAPKPSEEAAKAGIWLTLGILSPAIAQGLVDRFQQDDERAADILGLQLAHRAGYDPFGGVQMLDALKEHHGEATIGDILATHPPYRQRREVLYAEAQRLRDGESSPSSSASLKPSPDGQ